MNKPFYQMNPEELLPWLTNFITVARARAAELPMLTKTQVDALEALRDDLEAKLNARVAAEEAKESAVRALTAAHEEAEDDISFCNTVVKADKNLPLELIEALGLPVSDGDNRSTLTTPGDLTVTPETDGSNNLKFDRRTNPRGTIFVYEYKVGDATEWQYLVATTDAKYTHTGQQPGVQIAYRVKATHKGESSAWSAVAVAYFKG